jgi:hypothetical protein
MNPGEVPEITPYANEQQHRHQQSGDEAVQADAIRRWVENCPVPLPESVAEGIAAIVHGVRGHMLRPSRQ